MAGSENGWSSSGYGKLAIGAAGGLLLGRFLPVLFANISGVVGGAAGRDPFANLIAEHALLLSLLDKMEATTPQQPVKRLALFLQFKRTIGKHALAEEDVVYPLLQNDLEREESTRKLYQEHANMKIHLFELQRSITEGEKWIAGVQGLRAEIAPHARQEEEVEFPQLRERLNQQQTTELKRKIHQEEALIV